MMANLEHLLCRAKRKSDGVWVYGFYVEDFYLNSYIVKWILNEGPNMLVPSLVCEVDKNTVCRAVGIKDEDGKLIYEGDILSAKYDGRNPDMEAIVYVKWLCGNICGWHTVDGRYDPEPVTRWDDKYWTIKGNIFDNAALAHDLGVDC